MKILIIGHACAPGLGSEPGITWNWAESLSRLGHQVWVIAHPESRERVEAHFAERPNVNLVVHFVNLRRFDPWDPAKGERGLKLHYLMWLGAAFHEAKQLHQRVRFDVIHHVGLGTVATGSPFWRLDAPFVWGPVGGAQLAPRAFRHCFNGTWTQERLRSWQVACLPYRPAVRSTAQQADLCLATNHETLELLRSAGAFRAELLMDGGTVPQQFIERQPGPELQLLWAGRLEPRKALPLLLYALAGLDVPYRLRVAGSGPCEAEWREIAARMGLSGLWGPPGSKGPVEFLGRVAPEKMPALFQSSDAFAFTSLRDTFGTVVLEAMSHGLPILTLDHQGVGSHLPPAAAIKVPVGSLRETVDGLTHGVRYLSEHPCAVRSMGRAAWDFAQSNSWEKRALAMTRKYEEIIHD